MARGKGEKKAMSRKEIQQKYVNKMKSEKSEEWRQRRKERNQKLRENRSEEKKIMLKIQNREQKKAKRAEEKAKKQSELLEEKQKQGASAYKTKAAYGKAKSKALKGLPEEQERAMEVVLGMKRTLERRMGPREEVWEEEEDRGVKSTSKLLVQKFFFRQDIAYEFPGMKDYVRVKKAGEKAVKMTKYILLLTLKECYAEFKDPSSRTQAMFSYSTTSAKMLRSLSRMRCSLPTGGTSRCPF